MKKIDISVLDHLKKWIHINDVKNDNILVAGEYILDNADLTPFVFTQKWAILEEFWKLAHKKISEEDFYYFWDSFGKANPLVSLVYSGIDAMGYIKTKIQLNPDWPNEKIIILDELLKNGKNKLKEWKNILFV